MSELTVILTLHKETVEELGRVKEELGRVKEQLEHAGGLSAANLVRDTLDDFKKRVLQPRRGRKYLPVTAPETAVNIKNAYIAFLNDQSNQKARSLKAALSAKNISIDDFIDHCMNSYARTSSIIHACAQAFRTLHSLDEYLAAIESVPRLSPPEKQCIEIMATIIPY